MQGSDPLSQQNTSVIHTLLSPFRWAISLLKWASLLGAVSLLVLFNQTAWLVGYGNHGLHARQQLAQGIANSANSSVWNVDFSHREMSG